MGHRDIDRRIEGLGNRAPAPVVIYGEAGEIIFESWSSGCEVVRDLIVGAQAGDPDILRILRAATDSNLGGRLLEMCKSLAASAESRMTIQ